MQDWERAWQPVLASVGEPTRGDGVVWGADPVERGAIRRYLEPLEFDCPLHHSRDVARRHGFPDVIAPYTSVLTWAIPPLWSPGEQIFDHAGRNAQPRHTPLAMRAARYPAEATDYFATGLALDFARPPVVGDRIGRRDDGLVDAVLKHTRVGRGAFLTRAATYLDGEGIPVATMRLGSFVYAPDSVPTAASPVAPPAAEGPPAPLLRRQRLATDVTVGELLAPTHFPLSVYRLVMAAGANRDLNAIHHNSEYARAAGAREMYANVMLLAGMWERAVRDWIGCAGAITRLSGFRMRSFNTAEDSVVVHGQVRSMIRRGDCAEIDLAVWSENEAGVTVGPGTVTVTLPTRAGDGQDPALRDRARGLAGGL